MRAKLFCGILYSDPHQYELALKKLVSKFGEIDAFGPEYDFDFTDYYFEEFGSGLKKRFVAFREPVEREELPKIKVATCKLEKDLGNDKKNRVVNIDPGYITKDSVVVASTKEMPHRVYLGKGIFADIQMILTKEKAFFYRHTFRDYENNAGFFLEQRKMAPLIKDSRVPINQKGNILKEGRDNRPNKRSQDKRYAKDKRGGECG